MESRELVDEFISPRLSQFSIKLSAQAIEWTTMAPSAFSRMLSPKKTEGGQFAPDGVRDLSDTTHEDYDPATDPELRQSFSLHSLVASKLYALL